MTNKSSVPPIWKIRNPLLSEQSYQTWKSIQEDPNAPRWNHTIGDRVQQSDLDGAHQFRLRMNESYVENSVPSDTLCRWLLKKKNSCWGIEKRLKSMQTTKEVQQNWSKIETCTREELVTRMVQHIPHDIEFERALVYDTSGTTGHPLEIFHHPSALAQNHMFADVIFERLGIEPMWSPEKMGCLNICAQRNTYVFCNTFSVWNGAGFAKINLNESDWVGGVVGAREFCERWNPVLVTSDPISLNTAMAWKLPIRPKLIFSTAIGLTPELQSELQNHFECPVINWYAATEVGPIACTLPEQDGFVVLAPDLFVEVVDKKGASLPSGEVGEICVTGGRNPYLPLLRYRTGDYASIEIKQDANGVERVYIHNLQGRGWVTFYDSNNDPINSVDIDRIIRGCGVFVQHQVQQSANKDVTVRLRPVENLPPNEIGLINKLNTLFGDKVNVTVEQDMSLGDAGKIQPYICDVKP